MSQREVVEPQKRRSVLAYAKKPVGVVMMRPILRRLATSPSYEVFGAARLFGQGFAGRVFAEQGLPEVRAVPKWIARMRRFDVYLSADFGVAAPRARLKVHVFHGVSFRNHAVHSNALRYDLLLLAGPYMRRRFEEAGILNDANRDRFVTVGVPKLDDLERWGKERAITAAELGLDPARPTVLYAPTWSKKVSSLERHGEPLLRALAALDANVIIKLHDNSLDARKAGSDWRRVIEACSRPGMLLADVADVVPLMGAADVLVSDASSVANEFTLLDRPIVFVDVPDLTQRVKAKADLDTWGRKAGLLASGPHDLAATIERALAEPDRHSEVRRALAADLFAPPPATERAVAAIERALDERAAR